MKPAIILGLQDAWLWAVGLRFMSGEEDPSHLRSLRYERLCDGRLVKMTVPTDCGDEHCFVSLDHPMTEQQLEDLVRGRTKEALAVSEPKGNA